MRYIGFMPPDGLVKYISEWGDIHYEYEFIKFLAEPHANYIYIRWLNYEDSLLDNDPMAINDFNCLYDEKHSGLDFIMSFDYLWNKMEN